MIWSLTVPDKRAKAIVAFAGGWASDFGPSYTVAPQNGALAIPFLLTADNLLYELDGAPHKVGGSTRLNATAISDGTNIVHGFFDAWYQGTAGTETQIEWANVGTRLYSMDQMDGTWDSRQTGLEDSKEPCFFMAGDVCIWASTSTADVPRALSVTPAAANLGGSPPNFAFGAWHKNRAWAAGVVSNPSRLYYSALLKPNSDWTTAADAGSIDIDPDDGDRIVGLRSHKNELLVFKGPNRGSIHRITGSSPTGSDAFARTPYVGGLGSVNHNGIITVGDDVLFHSSRGIHSLAATAAFGDYVEAFLARPILTYYQDSLNHTVLNQAWGANYATKGIALWTVAPSGSSAKSVALVYDYRFQPGRWASWGRNSAYANMHSLAILQLNKVHRLYAGLTTGFVQRVADVANRSLPSSGAYTMRVTTPFLNFGSSAMLKNAEAGFVSLLPKGSYNLTFGWTRDTNAQETASVSQGGGDTLG